MALKIAINGFGRIGRALARQILSQNVHTLAAVNDPTDLDMSAYLFRHDSVHRLAGMDVQGHNARLMVNGQSIRYSSHEKVEDSDFSDCDIIFECSGVYTDSQSLKKHITRPGQKVILTAMPEAGDLLPVFVMGISDRSVLNEEVLSAGSCSTNALALILKQLDEAFGVESGSVTSVHSYMADQPILDAKNDRSLRFARAAGVNITPVSTGVAKNLAFILPELSEKVMGFSVRVPVPNVTMLDITLSMQKSVTISQVDALFEKAVENEYRGLLFLDRESRVSSDFASTTESVAIATDLTQILDRKHIKIVAWFDNETGYAARLYDLINLIEGA